MLGFLGAWTIIIDTRKWMQIHWETREELISTGVYQHARHFPIKRKQRQLRRLQAVALKHSVDDKCSKCSVVANGNGMETTHQRQTNWPLEQNVRVLSSSSFHLIESLCIKSNHLCYFFLIVKSMEFYCFAYTWIRLHLVLKSIRNILSSTRSLRFCSLLSLSNPFDWWYLAYTRYIQFKWMPKSFIQYGSKSAWLHSMHNHWSAASTHWRKRKRERERSVRWNRWIYEQTMLSR